MKNRNIFDKQPTIGRTYINRLTFRKHRLVSMRALFTNGVDLDGKFIFSFIPEDKNLLSFSTETSIFRFNLQFRLDGKEIDYKKELEDLIKMHNVLKDKEDFYYASYVKDYFEVAIKRLGNEK